jgi:hypothetical protein
MATHFVKLDGFEKVVDWYGRLAARDAFQKALPPRGATGLYAKAFYAPWPVEK